MFGMSDQLLSGMDKAHQSVSPSHINFGTDAYIDQDMADSIRKLDGVEDVELYNQVVALYKVHPDDDWKQGIINMKADYDAQKYDVIQLREGQLAGQGRHWHRAAAGQYLKVGIGDSITFKIGKTERTLPISGKIRHPFVPPPDFGGPPYFFVSGAGMERFGVHEGQYGGMLIRVTPPYSLEHSKEVATTIKDQLAKQDIGVGARVLPGPRQALGADVRRGHHARACRCWPSSRSSAASC